MQFVKTLTERNLDGLSSAKRMWGVEEERMFEIAVTVGKIHHILKKKMVSDEAT